MKQKPEHNGNITVVSNGKNGKITLVSNGKYIL